MYDLPYRLVAPGSGQRPPPPVVFSGPPLDGSSHSRGAAPAKGAMPYVLTAAPLLAPISTAVHLPTSSLTHSDMEHSGQEGGGGQHALAQAAPAVAPSSPAHAASAPSPAPLPAAATPPPGAGAAAAAEVPARDLPLVMHRYSDEPMSPMAGANGARTPNGGGSSRVRCFVYGGLLYGPEVVGRKLAIFRPKPTNARATERARVVEYHAPSGRHRLTYAPGKQPDEWVNLGDLKFKWEALPPPGTAPNPTWREDARFQGEAAVGRKCRVYWNGMQRWYWGTVKKWDAKAERHTVLYKDGDSQELMLRHQPVLWADDMQGPPPFVPTAEPPLLAPAPAAAAAASPATAVRSRAQAAAAAAAAASAAPAATASGGAPGSDEVDSSDDDAPLLPKGKAAALHLRVPPAGGAAPAASPAAQPAAAAPPAAAAAAAPVEQPSAAVAPAAPAAPAPLSAAAAAPHQPGQSLRARLLAAVK